MLHPPIRAEGVSLGSVREVKYLGVRMAERFPPHLRIVKLVKSSMYA